VAEEIVINLPLRTEDQKKEEDWRYKKLKAIIK